MESVSPLKPQQDTNQPLGLPNPEDGRLLNSPFGLSPADTERLAKEIYEGHKRGKEKRRQRDLTAEKYLVHIDGEGDGQWADIVGGSRVDVPVSLSGGLRLTRNYLRPLVENFVAYHTAMKYQVLARAKADREARDRAKLDTILANDILHRQKVNEVVAEALFFAAAYGHCPVHAMWRDDLTQDPYEPLYNTDAQPSMAPGFVDIYCGDPWDTVYNDAARRYSVQWFSYGRVLPAQVVREAFEHLPGIENLHGGTDLPSASRFQRIVRQWGQTGSMHHGTAAIFGSLHGEEMIPLVCREIAPGASKQYPDGALQIVALNGVSDTDSSTVAGMGGTPVLLHTGPLPGRRFSCVRFYASHRGDDVLGKPYVSDIDNAQTDLNQLVTLEAEFIRRFARPPLKVPAGALVDDTVTTEDDALLEFIDPQYLNHVGYLYPPAQGVGIFDKAIERAEEYMFRTAGWQAASRGESHSGDAAAKVVALARADDTIHGPIQEGIKNSLIELMQLCHSLVVENLSVPWVIQNVSGEDLGYLVEPYIHASQLSPDPPDYVVVSGYGATPEARGQQLMQLVQMVGADQKPLLPTDKFWKLWPDQSLAPPEISAKEMREARAQKINYAIQKVAEDLRQQMGPQADQLLFQAHQMLMQEYPMLLDDPPDLHIEALSNLTQDEVEDPLVRRLATLRQQAYIAQMQQQQMAQMPAAGPGPEEREQMGQPQQQAGPTGAPDLRAGTVTSEAMNPGALASDVESLTQQATAGVA